jgi:PIN domain nuclease of toxin-antitoxin system
VVDTSVVLAVARSEQSAAQAQSMARGGLLGMANFVEAVTRGEELGYARDNTLALISRLRLQLAPVDRATADQALPLWKLRKQNLSLGDRLCIGLARARGLPVLTGDRRWKDLDLGVSIALFR